MLVQHIGMLDKGLLAVVLWLRNFTIKYVCYGCFTFDYPVLCRRWLYSQCIHTGPDGGQVMHMLQSCGMHHAIIPWNMLQ